MQFDIKSSNLFNDVKDDKFLQLIREVNSLGANIHSVKEKKDNKKIAVFYNNEPDIPVYFGNKHLAQNTIAAQYNRLNYQVRMAENRVIYKSANTEHPLDAYEKKSAIKKTKMIKDILEIVLKDDGNYSIDPIKQLDLNDVINSRFYDDHQNTLYYFESELQKSIPRNKPILTKIVTMLKKASI
ncbi:MAG: hypothetical protein U9N42_02175 [Campylobacterota bacterium]|nr:hypothetical protein [Campylobacterota bacterium]